MYTADRIKKELAKALPGAQVKVVDTTGTKDHFDALIVWDGFEGKSLVEQHQIVMAPLEEALKEAIHALSIKTFTPEKWKQRGGTSL